MDGVQVAFWIGFATFIATLTGPILAVEVSRRRDTQRNRYVRKSDVFRTLMRLRRTTLAPEFVSALNLIEVEFHDVLSVIIPWRRFLDNVNGPQAQSDDQARQEIEKRQKILIEILTEMAKNLDLTIDIIPIAEGGYNPMAHGNLEDEATTIRRYFVDLALGRRSLPVDLVGARAGATGMHTQNQNTKETP